MATTRNSTLYGTQQVSKYVQDPRDYGGEVRRIKFEHTVVSGETGGASANVQDKVQLCVLPTGCEVIGLEFGAENLWASAAVNGTLQLGDSGDDDRYMRATEAYDSAGGPRATEGDLRGGRLAFAGLHYRPTAETIVFGLWKTANPTVGKKFKGSFLVVMPIG